MLLVNTTNSTSWPKRSMSCTASRPAQVFTPVYTYKCSALTFKAFFTFLRANLALTPSAISSPATTPYLEPAHVTAVTSASSPLASGPSPSTSIDPLDDIPPLQLDTLEDPKEKHAAMEIVADSVAEMQHRAAAAFVGHPLCLVPLLAGWTVIFRVLVVFTQEVSHLFLMIAFLVSTFLGSVFLFTLKYKKLSKQYTSVSWLSSGRDIVIGAKSDGRLTGVLVLRLEPKPTSSNGRKRSRSSSFRGGRGLIRAWATKPEGRGKGVGKELLAAAARMVRNRCGKDAELGFCQDHAHSSMILPKAFNGPFKHGEVLATKAVQEAVTNWDGPKKKKR